MLTVAPSSAVWFGTTESAGATASVNATTVRPVSSSIAAIVTSCSGSSVAVLSDQELRSLYRLAYSLGMQALVEVHDEAEVERALAIDAHIIGVNNRNLKTFQVDMETTARLRALLPPGKVVVGESGIGDENDVRRMAEMGCDAILVGETFCKLPQKERGAKVRQFVAAGRG